MDSADIAEQTAEYAAFGPWVDEVTDAADVPRLYRDFPLDMDRVELVLKIPRNIARRDADPSMHLYDALVIVDDERMTVLSREGNGYTTRSVRYESLVAIADSAVMLDGRLVLHVSDGDPLEVAYNGSSKEVIGRLVARLRLHAVSSRVAATASPTLKRAAADIELLRGEPDEVLVRTWLTLTKQEPALTLAGAHPTTPLVPLRGWIARLIQKIRPRALRGAVIGISAEDIHVLHHRTAIDRVTVEDLTAAHTIIFRRSGTAAEITPHPDFDGVQIARITNGRALIAFPVPKSSGSESALATALP